MRWIFWVSAALLAVVSVLGLFNNGGNKFVRIIPEEGCIAAFANIYDAERSVICCTGESDDHAICPGTRYTAAAKILTSAWAFFVPLLGFLLNVACQRFAGVVSPARTQTQRNRFCLYVGVILARTGLLYLALNVFQEMVQTEESDKCWYASSRRSGKCNEHFDFADHVVLAVCQYFAIQVFEIYCAVIEYREFHVMATASATTSPNTRGPFPSWLILALPLSLCLVVAVHSLVLMYETAVFFHFRSETIAALLISWLFVGRYLMVLMGAEWAWDSAAATGGGPFVGMNSLQSPSRGYFLSPLPLEGLQ